MKTITTLQHPNDVWLEPLKEKEPQLAEGLKSIHSAIFLADDIADRQTQPDYAAQVLWKTVLGVAELSSSGYFWQFFRVLQIIYESELANLNFVPGQLPVEEELEIWKTRAALLDLYFEGLKCLDEGIDTETNRAWFEEFKKFVLINDDCEDILSGTFEDLYNCRRNYVVLTKLGIDGYCQWRPQLSLLKEAAQEIKSSLELKEPDDERLKIFTRGRKENA